MIDLIKSIFNIMVKIQVFSDLHIDFDLGWSDLRWKKITDVDADLTVCCGDISNRRDVSYKWIEEFSKRTNRPILLVLGNHDYYHSSLRKTIHFWRTCKLSKEGKLFLIQNNYVFFPQFNLIFSGSTWWTDLDKEDPISMATAYLKVKDFRFISNISSDNWIREHKKTNKFLIKLSEKIKKGNLTKISKHDVKVILRDKVFVEKIKYSLEKKEEEKKEEKYIPPLLVVLTHHLPSIKSIDEKYKDHPSSSCFVSQEEELISIIKPVLWCHGHTHSSFDYLLEKTRVICNPYGYCGENEKHKSDLIISI